MTKKLYPEESVQAVADAIRAKTGKTDTMTIGEMAGEVEGILPGERIIDGSILGSITIYATVLKEYAFYKCYYLTDVYAPNATEINTGSFDNNAALKSVDFPIVKTIGANCFYSCANLRKINIPKCEKIGQACFHRNENMQVFDLPKCTEIATFAFRQCKSLKALILRSSQICSALSSSVCPSTPIESGTGYIYVPAALIEDYKVATNWSTYASQFRALEDYTVDGTVDGELDESKI